jgi:diacylglycerol O-acyltransferase-1
LVVFFCIYDPLIGTFCEVHAIIVCLKTVSYALTNQSLRYAYLNPLCDEKDTVPTIYGRCPYPSNINLSNLAYFWWAPTLVYQPVYPRTPRIRWNFVAKRLAEVLVVSAFVWAVGQKHALPVLRDSMETMASLDFSQVLERMMKLSAITLIVWLAGFFAVFQSFLNALAEAMQFADRDFYGDWWNSPFGNAQALKALFQQLIEVSNRQRSNGGWRWLAVVGGGWRYRKA